MIRAKIEQAIGVLNELEVDLWMLFTRESSIVHDPCLDLVVGANVVWPAAFLLGRGGERIAIVGSLDAGPHEAAGHYGEIVRYVRGIGEPLREALRRLDPRAIAVNWSLDDDLADGLTHGQHLLLVRTLQGTPYAERLVSAEKIVARLRGRKVEAERARIERACAETVELFAELSARLRIGMTERHIAAIVTELRERRGLACAWEEAMCPAVFAGPEAERGHTGPSDRPLKPGHLLSIDFGMRWEGYCSDLQRTWYCLRAGEDDPPPAVRRAFETERDAIRRAFESLRPGVRGVDVDAVAREHITSRGYANYAHALGHQIGRQAHDGAGLLGPAWERYGERPFAVVEEGQCYTLEPSVLVPGHGVATMEEVVAVTADGARFLSRPQTEILLVGG
ncbi:MAG: Xaa-Pro peptidase family protein [Planctomycetota bacterium]